MKKNSLLFGGCFDSEDKEGERLLKNNMEVMNMTEIKVCGNAMVVTSGLKLEEIKDLAKANPKSLKIIDEETKDEIFAIGVTAKPSLTVSGACFTNKNNDGYAQMTLELPTELETNDAKKKYIVDNYTGIITNLNALEEAASQDVAVLNETKADLEENIEIN